MKKMDRSALRSMLNAMKTDAMAATQASRLSNERDKALMYYMGDVSSDLPTIEGRSAAVSTDVADTVEGLMPSLMEIFAGGDQVVEFNPVGPEDVEGAKQESDYINHVFMNQNPGFLVLYSFIKDALLSKNGIVKVWAEKETVEENETYYDLTDDQFNITLSDPEVEITEHTERPIDDPHMAMMVGSKAMHDVKVTNRKSVMRFKALGVPPEEFGIEKTARSVPSSNYCFHRRTDRTQADLLADGYDKKQVSELPTYGGMTNSEETNRDSVDESQNWGDDYNEDTRHIEVTEHYIRMDYKGEGTTCLYRVTTGGEEDEILRKDGEDDIEEFDEMPFAAMTPVPVTHRFFGRSIADLTMDIQKIKTALVRSMLDNAYLANTPRTEVAESHASENTLDDLLVSRHGGVIRTKMPGGLQVFQVPPIGSHVYPLLEYMDFTREMRTGVSRQSQGIDAEALQNQSATAVSQLYSVAQAKVRLIARIFAETGIKDLFSLLHSTIRKHGQQKETYRLLNKWITVDPREWKKRTDMTIHVGLGSGGKAEQIAMMNLIAMYQEKIIAGGLSNIVGAEEIYNTGKDLARLANKKNVNAYFADPSTRPAPQPQPDPKIMELQVKAQIDQQKAQNESALEKEKLERQAAVEQQQAAADIATNQRKAEFEMAMAQQKFQFEKEMALINAQLERELKLQEAAMRREEHQQSMQIASEKAKAQTANAEG